MDRHARVKKKYAAKTAEVQAKAAEDAQRLKREMEAAHAAALADAETQADEERVAALAIATKAAEAAREAAIAEAKASAARELEEIRQQHAATVEREGSASSKVLEEEKSAMKERHDAEVARFEAQQEAAERAAAARLHDLQAEHEKALAEARARADADRQAALQQAREEARQEMEAARRRLEEEKQAALEQAVESVEARHLGAQADLQRELTAQAKAQAEQAKAQAAAVEAKAAEEVRRVREELDAERAAALAEAESRFQQKQATALREAEEAAELARARAVAKAKAEGDRRLKILKHRHAEAVDEKGSAAAEELNRAMRMMEEKHNEEVARLQGQAAAEATAKAAEEAARIRDELEAKHAEELEAAAAKARKQRKAAIGQAKRAAEAGRVAAVAKANAEAEARMAALQKEHAELAQQQRDATVPAARMDELRQALEDKHSAEVLRLRAQQAAIEADAANKLSKIEGDFQVQLQRERAIAGKDSDMLFAKASPGEGRPAAGLHVDPATNDPSGSVGFAHGAEQQQQQQQQQQRWAAKSSTTTTGDDSEGGGGRSGRRRSTGGGAFAVASGGGIRSGGFHLEPMVAAGGGGGGLEPGADLSFADQMEKARRMREVRSSGKDAAQMVPGEMVSLCSRLPSYCMPANCCSKHYSSSCWPDSLGFRLTDLFLAMSSFFSFFFLAYLVCAMVAWLLIFCLSPPGCAFIAIGRASERVDTITNDGERSLLARCAHCPGLGTWHGRQGYRRCRCVVRRRRRRSPA